MKKIILIILISVSLFAQPLLQQEDKQKHLVGSMAISGTATAIAKYYGSNDFEAICIGIASSLLVGIAKEKYDANGNGTEDVDDIYADALGAVVGSALSLQFSWQF